MTSPDSLSATSAPAAEPADSPSRLRNHLPAQAIELKGLEKRYAATARAPAKQALKGIDLVVPRGSFFGLLGPNGAGKSTLINILAGLVAKSSGQVKIAGIDIDRHPRRARLAIGVVPQEVNFDPFFTPREIIDFQAGLYGVPARERRTEALLEAVGLLDKADAHARSLSGGMRRRLLIAKALVHQPPVVVLDEPTAGVDVELRRSLWRYMRKLNESGVTVILTTHYLEEAQELCDRIAIIDQGAVVACDTTHELLHRLDEKRLCVTPSAPLDVVPPALAAAGWELDGMGRLNVAYKATQAQVGDLLAALTAAGIAIADLSTSEPDLETLFVRLTHHD